MPGANIQACPQNLYFKQDVPNIILNFKEKLKERKTN